MTVMTVTGNLLKQFLSRVKSANKFY